jgi:hypothetical protein
MRPWRVGIRKIAEFGGHNLVVAELANAGDFDLAW